MCWGIIRKWEGRKKEGNVMGIILGTGRSISKLDARIKYEDGERDKPFTTLLTSFQQRYYSISKILIFYRVRE